MKKFKFYQFALALVAAVLISAAASELNTATAAPAANLQNVAPSNVEHVQKWHHRRRGGRWIAPAIALGVVGAAAAAAANQNYYNQGPGYYEQPYGYYQQPRQRCFVQTDPVYNRGYYTWC